MKRSSSINITEQVRKKSNSVEGCSYNHDHIEDDCECAHLIDHAPEEEAEEVSSVQPMVDTEREETQGIGVEEDTTLESSPHIYTLDASAVAVVLREMGMYSHFTETIQRSSLKTVSTINNFSSFLVFVNQFLAWVIDVSKLIDEVDRLIEHVISKGYMQVGRFCKHLSTVR